MRLPGMKLAQRSLRQARGRLLGGIVVLGYHRLGEGEDPLGLAVSACHFAAHLDVITRHAHPMRLFDAVRAAAGHQMPPRAVAVTFDDGYRDTCEEVLPLLEGAGVPATVFVSTGCPGREFWWDELAGIIMDRATLPARLDLRIRGGHWSWSLNADGASASAAVVAARRQALTSLAGELCLLCPKERDEVMAAVRLWAGAHPNGVSSCRRALTTEELQRLAASPCVEIGAHTVSHPMLTALTPAEQRQEIDGSRTELQRITGTEVTSFSYPHGAYSAETRAMVAEAGFTIACCSTPDVLTRRCGPLEVPRLWVGDMDAGSFAHWLGGWFPG